MYDSSSSLDGKMGRNWNTSGSIAVEEEEAMEVLLDEPKPVRLTETVMEKEDKVKRKFPEEEDEEILKESNSRFVLFPIKYREVSHRPYYTGLGSFVDLASV
jgi:hypothetical protein